MDKNREKSVERPQNKNLKKDAGPGRPPGLRNYATIYREAMEMLAKKNATTVEKLEAEIIANGMIAARKGDYRFYKDNLDRLHGTATIRTDNKNETNVVILPSEVIAKLNADTKQQTEPSSTE